jgi:2,3-dihydroxyphenylpropionate 1,2-dioxygenase
MNHDATPAVAALGISHSPLKGQISPKDPDSEPLHDRVLAELGAWIQDFKPDFIVMFGPDHYRGFFNDLMPPFCIGVDANSLGDWRTSAGPIKVPGDIALACTRHLHEQGIDAAFSHRMKVDHGFVQPLDWLGLGLTSVPVLPVFINCWARPLPSFRRVREFGTAIGNFLAGLDKRVVLIGSGGLSHDPPVPDLDTAPPAVRERIIVRQHMSAQDLEDVVVRVTGETRKFLEGGGNLLKPDDSWDREFLALLDSGELERADALGEGMEKVSGRGGHEVRTWVAAFSALRAAAGPYRSEVLYHRNVPEWLTGMGIVRGLPANGTRA